MIDKFNKLYKRKVYTHHYKQYMDESHFDVTVNAIQDLVLKYESLEN